MFYVEIGHGTEQRSAEKPYNLELRAESENRGQQRRAESGELKAESRQPTAESREREQESRAEQPSRAALEDGQARVEIREPTTRADS